MVLHVHWYQCWCGDDNTDYDANGPATCDFDCAGNSDEICGGRNAMSVYSSGSGPAPAPVPDTSGPTYIGCFADTKDDRIMTDKMSSSSMTSEVCFNEVLLRPGQTGLLIYLLLRLQ